MMVESPCPHEAVKTLEPDAPPATGDVCFRDVRCPHCGQAVKVEFMKVRPMVDDIYLSPKWCVRELIS